MVAPDEVMLEEEMREMIGGVVSVGGGGVGGGAGGGVGGPGGGGGAGGGELVEPSL